jgi:hypothetical protein
VLPVIRRTLSVPGYLATQDGRTRPPCPAEAPRRTVCAHQHVPTERDKRRAERTEQPWCTCRASQRPCP